MLQMMVNDGDAEMLIDCQDDNVDFCILQTDGKQNDFTLNFDEWQLLKAFIDQQMSTRLTQRAPDLGQAV
jgi:hypothetical protein